jgi:ABC-type Na+ efflux pump permease subunit
MRAILLLALNDLRRTVRDKPAFIWMLAFPIGMMWFFGSLGSDNSGPPEIGLTVINHDQGWISTALIEELQDERIDLHIASPDDEGPPVRALVIPAGFTQGVLAGEQQVVRLEKSPKASTSYSMAAQVHILRAVVRSTGRLVQMSAPDASAEQAEVFRELAGQPQLVRLAVTTAGEGHPTPGGKAQSIPGMLTMTVLMMTLIYGAVFLTLEKRLGMLRRQVSLPLSRIQLYLGKLVGRLMIASLQICGLLLAGRFLFGLSWGSSPVGLFLVVASYALAVAALSTLLGAILSTAAQASSVGWIVGMVLAALGGCWWPAELMPGWMQTITHALPTTWAMDGFHALISFGYGVEAVLLPATALVGFALLFSLLGAKLLRFEG